MKLKLSFYFLLCSYFYYIDCSKQLFSFIEKRSSQQPKIKESIFGSYLEKVEKKIKKINKTENVVENHVNLDSEDSTTLKESKKDSAKKKNKKKILRKKSVLSHVKTQNNKKKHEKKHTVFDKVKSDFKRKRRATNKKHKNQNKYRDLKKRIVFLEKKMNKYIHLNKELIWEIRENKKKANHQKSSSTQTEEANDDD